MGKVLIFVEVANGKVRKGSLELLSAAQSAGQETYALALGPGAKEAALATAEATKDRAAELAKNMRWDPPGTIHRVGDRHVCVVTYESSIDGIPMKACQIAVSSDGGRTWGFISGSMVCHCAEPTFSPERRQSARKPTFRRS